jgi:carbamoyltransferase
MVILGLNFGHDGSVVVLKDGRVLVDIFRERYVRRKHAGGIDRAVLDMALAEAGVEIAQIDACAVTSTQGIEMLVGLCEGLEIDYTNPASSPFPCPLTKFLPDPASSLVANLRIILKRPPGDVVRQIQEMNFPEHKDYAAGNIKAVGLIENHMRISTWAQPAGLGNLIRRVEGATAPPKLDLGFHYPLTVVLDGRRIPGIIVHHQMAHAASVYYRSGFKSSAIMTHDGFAGGESTLAGMFFLGRANKVYPIAPHHLQLGALYDRVSVAIGFDGASGAGKLMGLAPYGRPVFYSPEFIGNHYDYLTRFGKPQVPAWLDAVRERGRDLGYTWSTLGDAKRCLEPMARDLAASTQMLLEETMLDATRSLRRMAAGLGENTGNLCLSGGTALNCPANGRIFREGPFRHVFVEPNCDDGGIATGAALHLYHNVVDCPLASNTVQANQTPFLGRRITSDETKAALDTQGDAIVVEKPDEFCVAVARLLADDKVVAWFDGRSEVGPRALGHRSLLADARNVDNWRKLNEIKEREMWRPLAPLVLQEHAAAWFHGAPEHSPYMLFTAQVCAREVPAITHVDKSARIQTVDRSCGQIHAVLSSFHRQTGVPILINTSLNGRAEPIVETPEQALKFLISHSIDVLAMEGLLIRRR